MLKSDYFCFEKYNIILKGKKRIFLLSKKSDPTLQKYNKYNKITKWGQFFGISFFAFRLRVFCFICLYLYIYA